MEKHGTTAPLVGFLTDRGLREPGSDDRDRRLGQADRRAGGRGPRRRRRAGRRATATRSPPAIGGLGVAIELVDIAGGEVEEILAGDIFHRHVLLGAGRGASTPTTLRGEIRHGDELTEVDDPLGARRRPGRRRSPTSRPTSPRSARRVRAGDVLITGSIVPALAVAPGDRLDYRLEPLGELVASRSRSSGAARLRGYTPRALAPMAELVDAPG